jgi:NAD(P)-dependent dehydrogenase (short-subunit alcohol dehydrogenase family)
MPSDDQDQLQPPQRQSQPGIEQEMTPTPDVTADQHRGAGKLAGKVALISGGDSGIGRAVAVLFAREGADVAIGHLAEEDTDANETVKLVEAEGRRCLTLPGDIGDEAFCQQAVERTVRELGRLDVLVNNAAEQHTTERVTDISAEQLERTFRTNIFAMFFLTKAALPHLGEGAAIVNTTSVTAYQGNPSLLDYSSTKGAIVAFTRATMPEEKVASFGKDVPMGRPGQPEEVAPCYVFLASDDASYMAGQVLHPNGGKVING